MVTDDLLQAADLLLLGGDVPEALEMLAQAAAAAPADPEPPYRMAEIHVARGEPGDLRAGLDCLDRAQALGMTAPGLHFLRMRAAFALGEVAAAQEAYAAAVAAAPADARLREWGLRLARAAGDPGRALRLAREELAADPGNATWRRWEAALLLEVGDPAAARDALTALLAGMPPGLAAGDWAAPGWAALLLQRADAAARLGDVASVQADRARAAALLPCDDSILTSES